MSVEVISLGCRLNIAESEGIRVLLANERNVLIINSCAVTAEAVRQTLARALESGGSTLRDFRDAHGMAGAFQLQARVYGRAGKPCLRCGSTVRRIVQAQRATYFCSGCQRR